MPKKSLVSSLTDALHHITNGEERRENLVKVAKFLIKHGKVKISKNGAEIEFHTETDFFDRRITE